MRADNGMAAMAALHRCDARDRQDVTRCQIHGHIPRSVSSIATLIQISFHIYISKTFIYMLINGV